MKKNKLFKKIRISLKDKVPKPKGNDQIGDRFKLLAHEFLNDDTNYDEALIRATALYLRREQHLKNSKNLDKIISYIQLFLNETKDYKNIQLVDTTKKSRLLSNSYESKPATIAKSDKRIQKGEITVLRSKVSRAKGKSNHFLSNEIYKQYKQGLTIIFINFSMEKQKILTNFLEKNKQSLNLLTVKFVGDLEIGEINELARLSKYYNIKLRVVDSLNSFQQLVKDIDTKNTGFIDFDSQFIDIDIEGCLNKSAYNSLLLPANICDEDFEALVNSNCSNGAIIPTYLMKKYDFKVIDVFTFNFLLIRLNNTYDMVGVPYSSMMNYCAELTLEDTVEYIQNLSSLPAFNETDIVTQKLNKLYADLRNTDQDNLLSISMQQNAYRIDFKKAFPCSFKNTSTLVIAYNFTPFVDPSAIVVAKRIQEEEWYSDVICNDMTAIRKRSESLAFIGKPYINSVITIKTKPTFAHQPHYQEFVDKSIEVLDLSKYEQVYSRSFFVAAHFLGFEVKVEKPEITWLAEFSDPGVFDVQGNKRYSWFRDLAVRDKYVRLVYEKFPDFKKYRLEENDNIYFWSELLPFCFADSIMFTCENQRRVMLNNLEINELRSIVENKSIVKSQPTLPEFFYTFKEVENNIEDDYINIAYFGSFYINRNFNDVFEAINRLSLDKKQKIKLHIYTNQIDDVIEAATEYGVLDNIVVSNYLDYLDFLNILDEFDYLFLMDTNTDGTFEVNPYLPSKLSDYLGSKAEIWAHCEKGSSLSNHTEVTHKSYIDTPLSIDSVINNLFSIERV
ncbi:glycosyltransferase family 4 protein [Psychrobacter sp. Cmf 22.2]|uniref:glycosyltransferase family 4 protein n=1 Tax=Psychrobacter sp. Cmf 22.2 TaxID=1926478 RepID=UPI00117ADBC2|nr:glycosyltransferase family 4 protein [Psychrobacter sp. Cmf 22.2]